MRETVTFLLCVLTTLFVSSVVEGDQSRFTALFFVSLYGFSSVKDALRSKR